jgi:hypothetical protein
MTDAPFTDPDVLILAQYQCGAIVLRCYDPDCLHSHQVRIIAACGVCTATGGLALWQGEGDTDDV